MTSDTGRRLLAGSYRTALATRLCFHFVLAIVAYVLVVCFVFPGHIFPVAAFHEDMYLPADFAAAWTHGFNVLALLRYPRPVSMGAVLIAGQLGFEGSVIFFTSLTLLNFATALALLERYVLKTPIPVWIALGTLAFAMVAPGFYINTAFDDGNTIALFFGLLGIYFWESRRGAASALLLSGAFFALSALAKESFVPAIAVYAVAAAIRDRGTRTTAAALIALPFIAVAVSLFNSAMVHSSFVSTVATANSPYRIDVSLPALILSSKFYLAPFAGTPFLFALLACSGILVWARRRAWLGFSILIASLLLYVPYLILPSHLVSCYTWTPMPLLMLLLPLGWVGMPTVEAPESKPPSDSILVLRRAAVILTPFFFVLTIMQFRSQNYVDDSWYLEQQKINGSLLAGVRSLEPALRTSHSVLIGGLSTPMHPWKAPYFLSRDLHFGGRWTIATEQPLTVPLSLRPLVWPVAYNQISWDDYDLVVIFTDEGKLAGSYRPEQMRKFVSTFGQRGSSNRRGPSNLELISALQGPLPTTSLDFSLGMAEGVPPGIFADASPATCCFTGPSTTLRLQRPQAAANLDISLFQPLLLKHPSQKAQMIVTFDAGCNQVVVPLVPGLNHVSVAVPKMDSQSTTIEIGLRFPKSFVPLDEGMGKDTRRLGVVLRKVAFSEKSPQARKITKQANSNDGCRSLEGPQCEAPKTERRSLAASKDKVSKGGTICQS